MPLRTINGAKVHVDDVGAGPPTVVFAHGLLWSGRMYAPQVAALKDRYRCISFDFRGQGRSERTESGYDMDTLTLDAKAIIDEAGAAPVHFVGLSMGGFVGLRLAIRHPQLLRSLTLIASAADGEPRKNIPKYKAMALVTYLSLRPVLPRVMQIMFGGAFLNDAARASERRERERELLGIDRPGMRRALDGVLTRAPVEEDLGRIETPTLVVAGEDDRAVSPERSRRAADRIRGAQFVTLPRAGHTATLEEPDAVTAALTRFWDKLDQK